MTELSDREIVERTAELTRLGFKNFDAFHLASAEASGARSLVTCDDQLLATARRHAAVLRVKVQDPITLVEEVFK